MIFTKAINIRNELQSFIAAFCFQTEEERNRWIKEDLPLEEKKYGKLKLHKYDLDGLKEGDRCHVSGEGDDVFTIIGIVKYSKDRYGFELDSGWTEEVVKCDKAM